MRCLRIGIVAAGIVLTAGVCSAQQNGPAMPEKVRAFLDKMTGNWHRNDEGCSGEAVLEWDLGKGALLDRGRFRERDTAGSWSELWSWDGELQDGIVSYWIGSGSFGSSHGKMHGRILSETVLAGEKAAIMNGKSVTARFEIHFEGADRVIWKETNRIVGGEKKPDTTETYIVTKTASDRQQLIKLEHELAEAMVKQDMEVIDRINGDEMTIGDSDGTFTTKEDVLAYVRSGAIASMSCEDLDAKVYGDMAVVTGKIKWTTKKEGSRRDLITDVFRKRDGRWRMVATHASRVPDEGRTEESAKVSQQSPEM
jgi:hypothetical protein